MIPENIQSYLQNHTVRESRHLQELVTASENELEHTDMLCGPLVGQLLALLVKLGGCRRILEIGTFTGYSTLWMAEALPEGEGEIMTLEMNERYRSVSDDFFARDPFRDKIRQIMGDALETLGTVEGVFDLVFLDADKARYPLYLEKIRPRLKSGGVLVVDNTLWGGTVTEPGGDRKSEAVDRMNRLLFEDEKFETLMLPVRDGVTIAFRNRSQ